MIMPWETVDVEKWADELGVNINELRQKDQLIRKIVRNRKRFSLTQGQLAEERVPKQKRHASFHKSIFGLV